MKKAAGVTAKDKVEKTVENAVKDRVENIEVYMVTNTIETTVSAVSASSV